MTILLYLAASIIIVQWLAIIGLYRNNLKLENKVVDHSLMNMAEKGEIAFLQAWNKAKTDEVIDEILKRAEGVR